MVNDIINKIKYKRLTPSEKIKHYIGGVIRKNDCFGNSFFIKDGKIIFKFEKNKFSSFSNEFGNLVICASLYFDLEKILKNDKETIKLSIKDFILKEYNFSTIELYTSYYLNENNKHVL